MEAIDRGNLDTLESRGASFAAARAGPRHRQRSSSSTPWTAHVKVKPPRHHSQLSAIGFFGISAYGVILVAAILAIAVLCLVLVYLVAYFYSHYT